MYEILHAWTYISPTYPSMNPINGTLYSFGLSYVSYDGYPLLLPITAAPLALWAIEREREGERERTRRLSFQLQVQARLQEGLAFHPTPGLSIASNGSRVDLARPSRDKWENGWMDSRMDGLTHQLGPPDVVCHGMRLYMHNTYVLDRTCAHNVLAYSRYR